MPTVLVKEFFRNFSGIFPEKFRASYFSGKVTTLLLISCCVMMPHKYYSPVWLTKKHDRRQTTLYRQYITRGCVTSRILCTTMPHWNPQDTAIVHRRRRGAKFLVTRNVTQQTRTPSVDCHEISQLIRLAIWTSAPTFVQIPRHWYGWCYDGYNVIFYDFLQFSMCYSLHVAVNMCIHYIYTFYSVNGKFTYDGQLLVHAAEVGVGSVSRRITVPAMRISNSERTLNGFAILSSTSRQRSPTEEPPAIYRRFCRVTPRVAWITRWNLPAFTLLLLHIYGEACAGAELWCLWLCVDRWETCGTK